jgi:hypothetical protein
MSHLLRESAILKKNPKNFARKKIFIIIAYLNPVAYRRKLLTLYLLLNAYKRVSYVYSGISSAAG